MNELSSTDKFKLYAILIVWSFSLIISMMMIIVCRGYEAPTIIGIADTIVTFKIISYEKDNKNEDEN